MSFHLPTKNCVIVFLTAITSFSDAQSSKDYWQQEVNYTIHVTLNDSIHFLTGDISIEYINHSPDTLQFIWFHLWPNAYSNTSTAFAKQQLENKSTEFQFSDEDAKGYIDSLDFRVNGKAIDIKYDNIHIDIAKLNLPEPLFPGAKIEITTSFRVKIPSTFSRLGHLGQQYQISQWYPKPAVYDHYGWHPMPCLDQGEFYSEFGSFDVRITVPSEYIVAATGSLQDEKELKWLDELAEKTSNKFSASNPADSDQKQESSTRHSELHMSNNELKTLQFIGQNVHDFAWFADKHYNVMKGSVSLPYKDVSVTTWTFFTDKHAQQWKNAIHFVDSAIYYYSKWIGDYPYPQATAVEGSLSAGDGMEYPMITVISGSFPQIKTLETVIAHEVGHNWLYGILGFNEREHPWMDEGINTYYENRYMEARYPFHGLVKRTAPVGKLFDLNHYPRSYQNYLLYIVQAYRHLDQPMDADAEEFTKLNTPAIVYSKSAEVMRYLENYLGTEVFDQLMKEFYMDWQFKHSYPEDLKIFFERKTKKELDWLFNQSIKTNEYLDYKISKAEDTFRIANSLYQKIEVVNKKEIEGPYSIAAFRDQQKVHELWYGGFSGKMEVLFPYGTYDYFRLDPDMTMPEVNRKNNTIRTNGILKHAEKFRLQWLGSIDNPRRTQLFFTPLVGWNYYDRFWLGAGFYNSVLPGKPLSFLIMPAYAFGSGKLVGLAQLNLQLFTKKGFVHRIDLSSSAKSYSYANASYFGETGNESFQFLKLTQQAKLTFRKSRERSPVTKQFVFRNIYLWQDAPVNYLDSISGDYQSKIINQLSFLLKNNRVLNPFDFSLSAETGSGRYDHDFYLKTFAEGNYKIHYPKKKYGVDLRLFTAIKIINEENTGYSDFHLSSTTGQKDYRFDHVFFGRTETSGFLSQQISASDDGGFKMRTDGVYPEIGISEEWILSLNLKASVPFFSAVFVFADCGIVPSTYNYGGLHYDAGVGIRLIPEIVEVYLPLFFSSDIKDYQNTDESYDEWYKRISFTFNIEKLNPFEFIRNFQL